MNFLLQIDKVTMFFNEYSTKITIDEERIFTRSYLELTMGNEIFQDGRLMLRCLAKIPLVYQASASAEITEDVPFIGSITGDASLRSHRK